MSKSKKKQTARARDQAAAAAAAAAPTELTLAPVTDVDEDDDDDDLLSPVDPDATRPQDATTGGQAVDEDLFERVSEAVHALGEDREEGEQIAWVWSGASMSVKYVEEEGDLPRRLMVAAFKRGVVYQVEGDRQLVYQAGPWEAELAAAVSASSTSDPGS